MRLSVSKLKSLTECGERHYLEKVVSPRLPQSPAAWTVMGSVFHDCYQNWELQGRSFDMASSYPGRFDEAVEYYKQIQPDLDKWTKTPNVKTVERDLELRREEGTAQAEAYEDHCLEADWVLWETPDGLPGIEVGFELELGEDLVIAGSIDEVLQWPDGRLTIRDTKTGGKRLDNRQLGLYGYAARKVFDLDIQWGEYFYTKSRIFGSGGWVNLDRYTEERINRDFRRLERILDQELFLANPGPACAFCAVKPWCSEFGWEELPT